MEHEVIISQAEDHSSDDVFNQESGSEGSSTDFGQNEKLDNHHSTYVTSPVRPMHFHHPEYISEVNNNNRVVLKHPQRRSLNSHPESGVDRRSLNDQELWNSPTSNQNQGSWYQRWQDKEEEDALERNERKKAELRKKTTEELLKLPSSMGKLLLKEQEKLEVRMQKECVDPRLTSRSPGANSSIPARPRYNSTVNSSPSRTLREARDTRLGYSIQNLSSHNDENANEHHENGNDQSIPRNWRLFAKYQFQSGPSTPSNVFNNNAVPVTPAATICGHPATGYPVFPSMPLISCSVQRMLSVQTDDLENSTFIVVNNEQAKLTKGESMPEISGGRVKLFPYHVLSTLNRRLPKGVDRTCLEKHLTVTEFERIFGMSRDAFWRLPKWKSLEMKKKVHLF